MELLYHQRMAEELNKDSLFCECQDRDSNNTYLNSESDRLAIISRQRHLEKLESSSNSLLESYKASMEEA